MNLNVVFVSKQWQAAIGKTGTVFQSSLKSEMRHWSSKTSAAHRVAKWRRLRSITHTRAWTTVEHCGALTRDIIAKRCSNVKVCKNTINFSPVKMPWKVAKLLRGELLSHSIPHVPRVRSLLEEQFEEVAAKQRTNARSSKYRIGWSTKRETQFRRGVWNVRALAFLLHASRIEMQWGYIVQARISSKQHASRYRWKAIRAWTEGQVKGNGQYPVERTIQLKCVLIYLISRGA